MRVKAAFIIVAAWLGLVGAASAQPMTAESMWGLVRVGAPALSPDGRQALFSATRIAIANETRDADLYLADVQTGEVRRLTHDPAPESEAAWSPDGRMIAFVARRGADTAGQIYVLPVAGGEAQRVTNLPMGARLPRWYGDSSRIAFLARVWTELETWEQQGARLRERTEGRMTGRVWDRAPISYWDSYIDDREWHVYVVDADGGPLTPVTRNAGHSVFFQEPGNTPYDVASNGELAFTADVDPGPEQNLDIIIVRSPGAAGRNITQANAADDYEQAYSPDGRHLAFLSQRIRGFYADRQRSMIYDPRTSATRELFPDWDRSADGIVWAGDSSSLYGAIDDAGTRRIYQLPLTGRPRAVTAAHDFTNLSAEGRSLVALRQSFSSPPTLVRIDPRSGAATQLSHFNDDALGVMDFGQVESVTYQGANGAPIQMWVIYPPGFDRSQRWPLYLLLHGGPHNGITDTWTWRWNAQVFAGWGYVVAWHNFHGSSGFGQSFTDSINPNRADLPYTDTIAAADWFANQPWIDRNRMVAGGGSYGGYLASVLLGRPNPFRALVAHAAVYNSYAQVAADYGAERDRFYQYWERPDEFHRYSPHMAAANFVTPTLVIHGGNDRRVPMNHGVELFNTLQVRGVPSRFAYYPNENHWVLNAQNSIHWYGEVRRWIEHYAPPGPNAAPARDERLQATPAPAPVAQQ
ncbi:MAG: prolyl oligopeptidase family serine peptidase [Hyphomonadaceae bacterium]